MAICTDNNTGSLTITLPDSTSLLSNITNSNGVGYYVIIKRNSDGYFATNYNSKFQSKIPTPSVGDVLVLTASSGDTFTFNSLSSGSYQIYVQYYDDLYLQNGDYSVGSFNDYAAISTANAAINLTTCNTYTYGCTDPNASNFNDSASVDDGSCLYQNGTSTSIGGCICPDGTYNVNCCPPNAIGGCTDPNALNFDRNANFEDGSCNYDVNSCISSCDGVSTVIPACIPNGIDELLSYNTECIAVSGGRYYTKHITGLSDSCSNMDTWKMIIINELMSRKGLPCLYNCTDENTPSISEAGIDCVQKWTDSGKREWDPADVTSYNINSVVTRDNIVYTATSNSGLNIDPKSKNSSNGWKKCNDLVIQNETKEYLPNFLKFAQQYCKDCDIPSYRRRDPEAVQISDNLSIGGSNIKINGATFIK